jgi:hypothetical protein
MPSNYRQDQIEIFQGYHRKPTLLGIFEICQLASDNVLSVRTSASLSLDLELRLDAIYLLSSFPSVEFRRLVGAIVCKDRDSLKAADPVARLRASSERGIQWRELSLQRLP